KVEVKDYICTVTIDRPPANATSKETYDEIRDTFYALDRREDIKVVILTGAGKIFMAGNELSEFGEFMEPSKCTVHYDRIRNAYLAVKNCRYPVIGAINGSAAGAGCAFAGCCDVLIAAQGAKFALSEIKVGIIGADGYASLMSLRRCGATWPSLAIPYWRNKLPSGAASGRWFPGSRCWKKPRSWPQVCPKRKTRPDSVEAVSE
ncbi:MAG: enoyl-CoA hydratase-related protein, partial [Oscillospiraceae bacterium]